MPPSTVLETISVSPWLRSAWRIKSLMSSGWSIISPCMNPPREVVYPSAMNVKDVLGLFGLPFTELVYRAAGVHRAHFDPSQIQLSTLLSVKTGGCPEDCAYCPQSRRYDTGVPDEEMLPLEDVIACAKTAKANGATRFCMGAAWRGPKDRDLEKVAVFIREVKALGLETCVTLGMLK